MKFYGILQEDSKINRIICAILINLPVFTYGGSIGWIATVAPNFQSENSTNTVALTDFEISWISSVPYITSIPGVYLVSSLSDIMGRKNSLIFISGSNAISWILMLSTLEIWGLILARALVGITIAGCYVSCPVYTNEIIDANTRGAVNVLVNLLFSCGYLFMIIIGDIVSYRTVIWIALSVPTFHMILLMMLPDSPSILVKAGKMEEATCVSSWLRCRKESDLLIKAELELIKKEQERIEDPSSQFLIKTIAKDKILFKAILIVLVLTLMQEFGGIITVLHFAAEIFNLDSKNTTIELTPNQQTMLLGAVLICGSVFATVIIDRVGRKRLLLVNSLIFGLSMCALASWFVALRYGHFVPCWIPILNLCICTLCYSSSLQHISSLIAMEIFTLKFRSTVLALLISVSSFVDFIQLLFFKSLYASLGPHIVFYFYGVVSIVMSVYVLFFVPETKARKLNDIYVELGKNKELENIQMT